jgi:hypothetical protein
MKKLIPVNLDNNNGNEQAINSHFQRMVSKYFNVHDRRDINSERYTFDEIERRSLLTWLIELTEFCEVDWEDEESGVREDNDSYNYDLNDPYPTCLFISNQDDEEYDNRKKNSSDHHHQKEAQRNSKNNTSYQSSNVRRKSAPSNQFDDDEMDYNQEDDDDEEL